LPEIGGTIDSEHEPDPPPAGVPGKTWRFPSRSFQRDFTLRFSGFQIFFGINIFYHFLLTAWNADHKRIPGRFVSKISCSKQGAGNFF